MTAVREAIGLPVLFLTVLLLGGIRIGDTIALLEPSVFALVLGLLLLRVLVQSGALAPERLMSPSRSALANLNGFVVLMALWAAAGQTIALLIPEGDSRTTDVERTLLWAEVGGCRLDPLELLHVRTA